MSLPLAATQITEFAAASLLIELTPGPNMGYLAIVAAHQGRTAALRVVAGATAGLAIVMLGTAAGVAGLLLAEPAAYQALRWAGVVYLGLLAAETWMRRAGSAAKEASGQLFLRGLVSNLLNVKAVVFYAAMMPTFVRPEAGRVLAQTLVLGAIHLGVSLAVHLAIVLAAAQLASRRPGWLSPIALQRLFAIAIAGTAGWLAWLTRATA